jgi:hypothetical protein
MRTTIDLPDELYRSLKARAAVQGTTLRELVVDLIERGLHPTPDRRSARAASVALPVAIPATGVPFAALTNAELAQIEAEEDLEHLERSPGHERLGRP